MSEPPCLCVIDTGGLHEIAIASGNLRNVALAKLKEGAIAVPSWAWQELKEAYPEDAEDLSDYVAKRVTMTAAIRARAGQIADKLNSGFPKGSHDSNVTILTASVAMNMNCVIVTSNSDMNDYEKMKCTSYDLANWVSTLE